MKNKKIFSYFLAFIIPMLIMVLLYMIVGIYPFGSKTVLTVDLQNFSAFKDIVQNGGNIFYSFSKTLGGNMYGLICYYLLSPFNIILLLFSKANIIDAVFLINVLKIGFCGLTSFIYFDKTFKYKTSVSFMFSICYSLMAYNIVYSQNIMWLDGVICLPIVFLGIDKLLNKKPILFFISLTISIFSNYYIGYMTCIASLIYFIYKLYLKNNYKFSIKKDIKEIIYFFKYTLLSVGVTAIIIIPSVFSLLAGKVSSSLSEFIPKQTYAFFDLLSKFYLGSFKNSDLSGGTPIVYVSVIMIFLLFLYFVNKKIDYKEKKASAILLSVFFISFTFYSVDLIWHTFQHPAGFSYRYSFIFDFVLLIIAYKSYININKIDKETIYNKCKKIIDKKIKSNTKYSNYMLNQKIISDLVNKGYDMALIKQILENEVFDNNLVIEKEFKKIYNKLSKKFDGSELYYNLKNKLYQKGFTKEEIEEYIKTVDF